MACNDDEACLLSDNRMLYVIVCEATSLDVSSMLWNEATQKKNMMIWAGNVQMMKSLKLGWILNPERGHKIWPVNQNLRQISVSVHKSPEHFLIFAHCLLHQDSAPLTSAGMVIWKWLIQYMHLLILISDFVLMFAWVQSYKANVKKKVSKLTMDLQNCYLLINI